MQASPEAPLHDVAKIETPEHIEVSLVAAGLGSRAAAYALDLFVQLIPMIALGIVLVTLAPAEWRSKDHIVAKGPQGAGEVSLAVQALVALTMFAINFGYYTFFELVWRGQTPGKRAMHLRVVRDGGLPVDGRSSLVRNLLRVVDILPTGYAVGMVSLVAGGQGKRLGDFAAGTLVIRERQEREASGQERVSTGPVALQGSERHLVADFLQRRDALPEEAREKLALQIATHMARRLQKPLPSNAEAFLEELAKA